MDKVLKIQKNPRDMVSAKKSIIVEISKYDSNFISLNELLNFYNLQQGEYMKEYTVKVYDNRTVWLNKDDKYHREDGPAIEYVNGDKIWYKNGEFHREDGPAFEYTNGDKIWFKDGQRHREDGPAIEYKEGDKYWYKNGKFLTQEEFNSSTNSCCGTIVEIHGKKYKLQEA